MRLLICRCFGVKRLVFFFSGVPLFYEDPQKLGVVYVQEPTAQHQSLINWELAAGAVRG
jgi:hypothetical protein